MTGAKDELLDKRRALQMRWKGLRAEIKALEGDMKALDRVLNLLSPDGPPPTSERRGRAAPANGDLLTPGQMAEDAVAILASLGRDATSHDVAVEILRRKGVDADDSRLVGLTNRISALLGNAADRGKAERVGVEANGHAKLWRVKS